MDTVAIMFLAFITSTGYWMGISEIYSRKLRQLQQKMKDCERCSQPCGNRGSDRIPGATAI